MKKWETAILIGMVITIALSFMSFNSQCADIRTDVLRLHILANSDSDEDQALKLLVRDKLLEVGGCVFGSAATLETATELAEKSLPTLKSAAEQVIAAQGYNYPVEIEIGESSFDTRTYGDITLPAGDYQAVRVIIGSGEGHNWWCVMYPALCIPAAAENADISDALDDSETEIVENRPKYEIRFKSVELIEQAVDSIREFFGG